MCKEKTIQELFEESANAAETENVNDEIKQSQEIIQNDALDEVTFSLPPLDED